MNIKINTISDRIRNGLINSNELKNIQDFAKAENMLFKSIPLKDGTTAKILANAVEYDCLIMKNGKVVTSRGQSGTTDNVAQGILGLFEHINKRKRADNNINIDNESFDFLDKYLNKYDKFLSAI